MTKDVNARVDHNALLIAAAERYMLAVRRLGEDSGYNRLTYFEAPILKMPTEEMRAEAHGRWLELNNAGQLLTGAVAAAAELTPCAIADWLAQQYPDNANTNAFCAAIRSMKGEVNMTEARMDGTLEQRLLWRVLALREALSDIEIMKDGVSHQIARNALLVDDDNAKLNHDRADIIEECMDMLGDVPGDGLVAKLTEYIGNYMAFQIKAQQALSQVEEERILTLYSSNAPVEAKPFYGAKCPSYPNCNGGCGMGCAHEIEVNSGDQS